MSDTGIYQPLSQSIGAAPTPIGQSTGSLDRVANTIGSGPLDPSRTIPGDLRNFLSTGKSAGPQIVKSLPDNMAALQNKYAELAPVINELPPEARNTLLQMDSDRVARGAKPLTREETISLAQTWLDKTPATPRAGKKPLDIIGNTTSNLGAIVKSIPQIPGGIINEVLSIGQQGEGSNSISQMLNAPGVRLIPGAFIGANLAEGTKGLKELATNPLFTALDAMPFLNQAAKATRIGQLAAEAAELTGKEARPLAAVALRKLDEAGTGLVDRAGTASIKELRDSTKFGQTLDAAMGGRAREVSRLFDGAQSKVRSQAAGLEDLNDPIVRATVESQKIRERYVTEHGWTDAEIATATEKIKLGDISTMNPVELSFKNEVDDVTRTIGEQEVLEGLLGQFDTEFYTVTDATKLHAGAERVEHYRDMVRLRDEWRAPSGTLTTDTINESITRALNRNDAGYRYAEFRNIMATLDAYGLVTRDDYKMLTRMKDGIDPPGVAADLLRSKAKDLATARPLRTGSEIITDLNRAARSGKDLQAGRLADALADGNAKRITQALNNITHRTGGANPLKLLDEFTVDSIRSLQRRYQYEGRASRGYTMANSQKVTAAFDRTLAKTPPARFGPIIADRTIQGVTGRVPVAGKAGFYEDINIEGAKAQFLRAEEVALGRALTSDDIERLTTALTEKRWGQFKFDEFDSVADLYKGIERETAATWRMLREEGYEPSFVHVTSKSRVNQTLNPKAGPIPVGVSQLQERALDFSPGINDATVAMTHQGMEILSRRASLEALNTFLETHGIRESAMRESFAKQARDAAQRDPLWGFEGELREAIGRKYSLMDEKRFEQLGFGGARSIMDKYAQDGIFIPRALDNVLGEMTSPSRVLGGVFDPVTKLFRISVVGLSPRTQLYNILGGATMMMGETGPGAFRYAKQAWEWARNPELITDVSLRRSIGSQRQIMADFDDLYTKADRLKKAEAVSNVAGGRTLGRLWNQIQQSKVKAGVGAVVEKSFDINAWFDDTYRIMGYLDGRDKALTKGMSRDVAERAGMEIVRKTMADWSGLTPIERGIMKSVFPFYSFMNHILRYVFRYPVDHPLRAAVLGSFGRAQVSDMELLPERFLGNFFFGGVSDSGRQSSLQLAAVNPFGDVANMLSFSGFLSATNPAIQTVLESVGLQRGEAELYPSLRYNPETGRLDGTRGNPITNFIENTIPQAQILTSLFGANTDFNERLQRDPASAIRTLWSAGGLPIVWRGGESTGGVTGAFGGINVVEEGFKAELARQDSQQNTLNGALRSGDWQNANRYPGLAGVQQRVSALPAEALAQFTPPESAAVRAQLEALLQGQQVATNTNAETARAMLDEAIAPPPTNGLVRNPIAQSASIGGI